MGAAQTQTPIPDATFVEHTMADNTAAIELGCLAETRANDPAVRRYADRIVVDHRAASADLKAPEQLTEFPAAMPRSAVVDQPWCDGAYDPTRGSNFGPCPR